MAAKVIGDAAEFGLEKRHEPRKGGARGADAVDEEEGFSFPLHREG
jgi:hypothetical protein